MPQSECFNACMLRCSSNHLKLKGLHADVVVGGVPVSLLDTAGMREASDVVERLGVERSRAAATAADIAIMVLDAQVNMLLLERVQPFEVRHAYMLANPMCECISICMCPSQVCSVSLPTSGIAAYFLRQLLPLS